MAKHKAATQVTIVQEERSSFGQLVDRMWKPAAAVAAIGAGLIIGVQYTDAKDQAALEAQWDSLSQAMSVNAYSGQVEGTAEDLEAALSKVDGSAAAWGQIALVTARVEERQYDQALTALSRARELGSPSFTEQLYPFGEAGTQMTLADHLEKTITAQKKWEEGRQSLFENPPAPDESPRVRFETSAGNIVVALYQDEAPKHVENLLKLCDEEFYDGTKFHRVLAGFMIQGGDPNTKSGALETWGQGGPGYKIEAEENDLHHFRGYLSAAKQQVDVDSSGSQFFFTSGDALHLDGKHVIFGMIVEGMDIVDVIEAGEIDMTSQTRDRPVDPVILNKVVKL